MPSLFDCVNSEITTACRGFTVFQKVCQMTNISVVITDISGKIVYVNDAICHRSGYTEEELLGQNPRIFKSGKQSSEVYEDLWKTVLSGKTWKGELANKAKDGSIFWEIAQISPVKYLGQTYLLGVKEDVTELKNLRDKIVKLELQVQSC